MQIDGNPTKKRTALAPALIWAQGAAAAEAANTSTAWRWLCVEISNINMQQRLFDDYMK
jgi:hypothetical protein